MVGNGVPVVLAVGVGIRNGVSVGVGVASCWMQVGQGSQAAAIMVHASTNSSEISLRLIAQPGWFRTADYCLVALPEVTWKQSVPIRSIWLATFEKVKELLPTVVVHCGGEPVAGVKVTLFSVPVPSEAIV